MSLKVSLEIKTLSKKKKKQMKKTKQHTVEVVLNRTTPVHILSRHTRRRAFVMSLISGHFQQVVCDSYRVLTKAVS